MILIIGIKGLIGKKIFEHLKSINYPTLGTTRIHKFVNEVSTFYFDLSSPDLKFLKNNRYNISHAVICSGETNIDKCKADENYSNLINVTNTIKLIEQLIKYQIAPIFLSSDLVFDGKRTDYTENSHYSAQTVYGRQKIEIENYLKKNITYSWIILRLSKVFDVQFQDGTLLTVWLDALRERKKIKCAYDQYISPTYVVDVCLAIVALIKANKHGVYNLCNPNNISRFELAQMFVEYLKINSSMIIKCSILDLECIEPRSLYATFDSRKICEELNLEFTSIEKCFSMIRRNYNLNE